MSDLAPGFIGIGKLGGPMASRLLAAGHPLAVFNRTPAKLKPLEAAGAESMHSPAALAARADVVFLCLADAAAVETVTFGEDGVAAAASPGKLLVDCSSIAPEVTRVMAERLFATTGMRWIDAPVSGGVEGARQGTLIFLCGGERAQVERVRPLFAALGQRVTHMGPVGSGQTAKLLNQAIVSVNLAAIAEVIGLARRAGVDPARLPLALEGGFADSLPLRIYGPRMASPGSGEQMGEIATMLKDMANVLELAQALEAETPMTRAAAELYGRTADSGHRHSDLESLVYLYDHNKQ